MRAHSWQIWQIFIVGQINWANNNNLIIFWLSDWYFRMWNSFVDLSTFVVRLNFIISPNYIDIVKSIQLQQDTQFNQQQKQLWLQYHYRLIFGWRRTKIVCFRFFSHIGYNYNSFSIFVYRSSSACIVINNLF